MDTQFEVLKKTREIILKKTAFTDYTDRIFDEKSMKYFLLIKSL